MAFHLVKGRVLVKGLEMAMELLGLKLGLGKASELVQLIEG